MQGRVDSGVGRIEQIEKQLTIEPGDEAVTLAKVVLMVKDRMVGKVSKGKRLKVEHVQDEWLWV